MIVAGSHNDLPCILSGTRTQLSPPQNWIQTDSREPRGSDGDARNTPPTHRTQWAPAGTSSLATTSIPKNEPHGSQKGAPRRASLPVGESMRRVRCNAVSRCCLNAPWLPPPRRSTERCPAPLDGVGAGREPDGMRAPWVVRGRVRAFGLVRWPTSRPLTERTFDGLMSSMPSSHDAVESCELDVLEAAFRQLAAETLNPAAEGGPNLRRKLARQLSRCGDWTQGGAGTVQEWAAAGAELSSPTARVEGRPAMDAAMRASSALLYEASQGRTRHMLGEHPEEILRKLELWAFEAAFLEGADQYIDAPGDAVSVELDRRRAAHRRGAGHLAAELHALAATLRARGKPELAALMEAAARRLARIASSSALEMDGVPALWPSRPDPMPPPQVLPGHSIWTHGPPDAPASSREPVASGERRALVST